MTQQPQCPKLESGREEPCVRVPFRTAKTQYPGKAFGPGEEGGAYNNPFRQ